MSEMKKSFGDKSKEFFVEWVAPIIAAYIVFILLNKFVFFNIVVPTESMYPTIKVNDRIMVTKIYDTGNIKRGDVIVFFSRENNEKYIKRVIGLPGDKIMVEKDGDIIINDKKIKEDYVKNQLKIGHKYIGLNYGRYDVPKDSFLFLGDNRSNSGDSRYWENPYISTEDILGKARITLFPLDRIKIFKEYKYD